VFELEGILRMGSRLRVGGWWSGWGTRVWQIDGRKLFCTMSPAATDLYVSVMYADVGGNARYAYAMVPIDAPGVVVNDDWDALGMRASGSNSVSLRGVELPESGVRGGFRAGDPLPYMGRDLVAGLFHAAASLGIAESADTIARQGIAGRISGDAHPRTLALSGGAGYVNGSPLARAYATSEPEPSCTRSAPTAHMTTSAMSPSVNSPRSIEGWP
jgi:hypothetical protein